MQLCLNNNLLSIDNYEQIIEIGDALIRLRYITINGNSLKIKYLDKYRIVIAGEVKEIKIGE